MLTCCLGNGRFGVSTFFATTNTASLTNGCGNNSNNGTTQQDNESVTGSASTEQQPVVVSPIYHGVQPSVRILGNFQRLFALSHKNLCRYVDAMVGRHEQVVFVQEFYETTLQNAIKMELYKENLQACLRIGCQLEMALDYLHSQGIIVGNMAASNVMLCSPGTWPPIVKLFNYGLFWASESGKIVEFPLAAPPYLAPEVVMAAGIRGNMVADSRQADRQSTDSSSKSEQSSDQQDFNELNFFNQMRQSLQCFTVFSDVWTLGILLAELFTSTELASTASNLHQLLERLVNIAMRTSGESTSACDMIFRVLKFKITSEDAENYKEDCQIFEKLIRNCLELVPSSRMLPKAVLANLIPTDIVTECRTAAQKSSQLLGKGLNPFAPRCIMRSESIPLINENSIFNLIPDSGLVIDHLRQTRPLEEVYYLLSLVSPDPRVLVKKATMQVKSLPAICKLAPVFLSRADRAFGATADRGSLYSRAIVEIPLEPLMNRLNSNLQVEDLYCLLDNYPELDEFEQQLATKRQDFFNEIQKQPLIIRERDPEYQLHRCVLFHRLLEGYPFTRQKLFEAAKVDVVPLYRGLVWCCLLDVPSDAYEYYSNIDVDSPHPAHRQIDVDIPRCHQYDDLLASHMGRIKLKRVLTAWLRKNPNKVYWQGLDSLLAPFLRLNFTNEPLALACFQRFIDKYLNNFFTRDNSDVVREYLGVFSHLIAFHDAELSDHLQKIGFVPDLYAISWFLTAFAHVFPLTKLYHLYDTLLLYDNNFLLCTGLAVLQQLRSKLISFEFNDCILLSSDMSDFDTARLVADATAFYQSTPPSLLRHPLSEPSIEVKQHIGKDKSPGHHHQSARRAAAAALISANDQLTDPVVISDPCGRISVQDLQSFWSGKDRGGLVVVDIRSPEEFNRGSFPGSVNIPATGSADVMDPQLQRLIFDVTNTMPQQQIMNTSMTQSSPGTTAELPRPASSSSLLAAAANNNLTTIVIVCNGKTGFPGAVEFARRLIVDFMMSRVCLLSGGTEALARASLLVIP